MRMKNIKFIAAVIYVTIIAITLSLFSIGILVVIVRLLIHGHLDNEDLIWILSTPIVVFTWYAWTSKENVNRINNFMFPKEN